MSAFFIVSFTTILSIVDPVGILPVFLAMTPGDSVEKKRSIALRATVLALFILCGLVICGSFIFRIFGISIPALRIAGGILLFRVALDMLQAQRSRSRTTPEEDAEGTAKEDISVFPLAVPLLAGPGAIASVMILAERAKGVAEVLSIHLAIILTSLIVYLVLRSGPKISELLGTIAMNVLTRLMGLFLAIISAQFVIDGMRDAFPRIF